MFSILWKDEWSVGIDKIDEQHQGLIALMNELIASADQENNEKLTEKAVEKLLDYTKYHFSTEEYMMKQGGYPELPAHKEEHARFIAKASDFFKAYLSKRDNLAAEIAEFLGNWIDQHIIKVDHLYIPYLKK